MELKGLKIGEKMAQYPIIQGGMGVGVSMHKLAGAVANAGGIGVISAADIGYQEEDFTTNQVAANVRAIGKEIEKAREIAKDKIIGMNLMVAMNNYADYAKEAVRKGINLIISGAGLPKELPEYVKGSMTKIAPIISSARACKLITKLWMTKHNYVPDMIVIEGPEAGGHLGFKAEELEEGKKVKLEDTLAEVLAYIETIEKETNKEIPVVVAGGIYDGKDIAKFLKLGASGVQMATRFVATEECDASEKFKQAYINVKQEDINIIKSPVGLPGRAIKNEFIQKVEKEKEKITKCYQCIRTCDVKNTPYCITKALINAVKGNTEEGLIFCGSNADKIDKIVPVKDLMQELVQETKENMEKN